MRPNKRKKEICNECEQHFIDEMNRLVGAVDGYSPAQHDTKSREVNEAFGSREDEPSGR